MEWRIVVLRVVMLCVRVSMQLHAMSVIDGCIVFVIQVPYNRKDNLYRLLRQVFALPFLPAADIPAAFERLEEKVSADAEEGRVFMTYVRQNWIESETWNVEDWSNYGRSIRSNNDVEGWHNRLNRRAKKGNLPMYLLIQLLFGEAKEIPTQLKLVKEGKLRRRQRKQTRQVQGMIASVWEKYASRQMSASRVLKECGRLYAPS